MYQVVSIVTYLPIILSVKKIYFILTYASTNLYTLVIYKSMPIVLFWVPREQGRSAVVSLFVCRIHLFYYDRFITSISNKALQRTFLLVHRLLK